MTYGKLVGALAAARQNYNDALRSEANVNESVMLLERAIHADPETRQTHVWLEQLETAKGMLAFQREVSQRALASVEAAEKAFAAGEKK